MKVSYLSPLPSFLSDDLHEQRQSVNNVIDEANEDARPEDFDLDAEFSEIWAAMRNREYRQLNLRIAAVRAKEEFIRETRPVLEAKRAELLNAAREETRNLQEVLNSTKELNTVLCRDQRRDADAISSWQCGRPQWVEPELKEAEEERMEYLVKHGLITVTPSPKMSATAFTTGY